jgi:membrane associated rhomboid family serine protease
VLNFLAFLLTNSTLQREAGDLGTTRLHICLLAASHPELSMPPLAEQLVERVSRRDPTAWIMSKSPNRPLADEWDARIRTEEDPSVLQGEMDRLTAHYEDLHQHAVLERFAFVPAHPTWYSYLTADFLHGGWLHIIGNMWFLWLAGIVLEDAWGRPLYLAVYLVAGIFALVLHSVFNSGSYIATLGASGAVAGLMGAFLIRFPKVRIKMVWLFGFIRAGSFYAPAYALLPLWFALELLSGTVFGASSGVAHMAHVGGFLFGIGAALAIRHSGLEHTINVAIEEQIDPNHEGELDNVNDLLVEDQPDQALEQLERYLPLHPKSERALQLLQDVHWRRHDLPAYARATQQLCALHLGEHALDKALKDYEDVVQIGGELLPAEIWYKLCQALEEKQEYERALGEYQELAEAHPETRQSLMALISAARLALHKVQRPQQALNLYQAAAGSPVPHLDLEDSIERGRKEAQSAMANASAAAAAH